MAWPKSETQAQPQHRFQRLFPSDVVLQGVAGSSSPEGSSTLSQGGGTVADGCQVKVDGGKTMMSEYVLML